MTDPTVAAPYMPAKVCAPSCPTHPNMHASSWILVLASILNSRQAPLQQIAHVWFKGGVMVV